MLYYIVILVRLMLCIQ